MFLGRRVASHGMLPHTLGVEVPVLGASVLLQINRIDVERRRINLVRA